MTASLITMSVTGLIVGFIFSMPIAGPISILVTSNALKGRLRYSHMVILGASIADFTYVLVAVFGLTKLYSSYKPAIPYILMAGTLFLIYMGYRIMRTKIDLEHPDDKHLTDKVKFQQKGGFYTGCMINLLNPTLFIGWLSTSFLAISFVAALGFNTGGLNTVINRNVDQINKIEGAKIENPKILSNIEAERIFPHQREKQTTEQIPQPKHFQLLISICYAFFLALGSVIWYYLLAYLIARFRRHINLKLINGIVYSMGMILCLFGIYFGYVATKMLFFQ